MPYLELKDIDLRLVYRNWKNSSNTFEAFIRSGPFVSLQTYDNFKLNLDININEVNDRHNNLISQITSYSEDSFIICDLDFNDCVEIAFLLNNLHNIKPIISFNMLFNPHGLIGTTSNIENIIKYGLNLNPINSTRYVLFTNYERYMDFREEEYKIKLNNQYEVCEDDLPYAETLTALGYTKVIFITKEKIKQDIENYLNYLMNSDIIVETNKEV